MKNTYVGIYIKDNELYDVITGTDKDMMIKFMKDLAEETFEEKEDKVYVYLNNQEIWRYDFGGDEETWILTEVEPPWSKNKGKIKKVTKEE